jgi:hypothetical protein
MISSLLTGFGPITKSLSLSKGRQGWFPAQPSSPPAASFTGPVSAAFRFFFFFPSCSQKQKKSPYASLSPCQHRQAVQQSRRPTLTVSANSSCAYLELLLMLLYESFGPVHFIIGIHSPSSLSRWLMHLFGGGQFARVFSGCRQPQQLLLWSFCP